MKILIFCPYYPPHIGGLENHADEFNKYLSQNGMDITVFTPRLPKDALEFETKYNDVHPVKSDYVGPAKREFNRVKIIRFPAFEIISNYPLPKFWLLNFWQLFFKLFKKDFGIVISRTRFFNTSLMAIIYAKIKKTRWVHIEHGSDFVQLPSRFKTFVAKLYDYTFGFLIFHFSDKNISISKAVQKFVNKFDKRESPIIYRGLDMERLDKIKPFNELREKYENKIIISFVGRLYSWKGVENSIRAVKSLSPEIKKGLIFIIAGNGEDLKRLKGIANSDEAIVFWEDTPSEKAIALLKTSDIYVHSAYSGGGLSTSLLEAMYCQCAVIATPNEGADEVIENNVSGIMIEKSNDKLIAEKIAGLIEDKEKIKRFRNNAKAHIANNFNWKQSIDAYKKLFRPQ